MSRAREQPIPAAVSAPFLRAPESGMRLRVGVVCNGRRVPRYVRGILDDLLHAEFVELVLVSELACQSPTSEHYEESLAMRLLSSQVEVRYRQYADPLELVESEDLLGGVERMKCRASPEGRSLRLCADDCRLLQERRLDVLLNFCSRPIVATADPVATYGLWYFHFGDSRRYPEGSGFVRELIDGCTLSGIELIQRTEVAGDDAILARTLFSTTAFPSRLVNRYAPVWGSRHLVVQSLWELAEGGTVVPLPPTPAPETARPARRALRNREVLMWFACEAVRRVWRKRNVSGGELHWRIGLRRAPTPLFHEPGKEDLRSFRWLESPAGHYWADPVLCEVAGEVWLFFEHMIESDGIAEIACGRIVGDGELVDVRTVLRRPHHLSYPQIIQADGEIYMLPEAAQSGGVDLYRARRFPDEWALEARLLDFRCVDSTVFRARECWWMVTSPQLAPGHAPITWLLQAERVTGPWHYCPRGVVSSSAATARGAGSVFTYQDRLIRPSQDCSRRYGEALVFNEIQSLQPGDFRESSFRRVTGTTMPRLGGVHSYSRLGDLEAIDGGFL